MASPDLPLPSTVPTRPVFGRLSADQITIAITVYSRCEFLKQCISSALNQTVPVRVMVVEDCGPDPMVRALVKTEFGDAVEYVRNPTRRGLFGNWNACLEWCRTKWVTILHDDDYLEPCYVEAMLELESHAPGRALYFGRIMHVGPEGQPSEVQDDRAVPGQWIDRGLNDILYTPFPFPGHLFPVQAGLAVGGFRTTSLFAGDWEMWAKLMAYGGGAQSARYVGSFRDHGGLDKGTNSVVRNGRMYATTFMQHKRVLSLLPQRPKFDRIETLSHFPLVSRFLLRHGYIQRPRLLRYHLGLLRLSYRAPFAHRMFQAVAGLGGATFIRASSHLWNRRKALFRARA
jgi:glycosyltransferase involved in cell wall biosynthesis